jgi:CRP-like cAMP-binding protein
MAISNAAPRFEASPARTTFRGLLGMHAEQLGLTGPAIERLITESQLSHWRAGQQMLSAEDRHDMVAFVVAGAVKVTYRGARCEPMIVHISGPGTFVPTGWLFEGRPRVRHFGAVAQVTSTVAMASQAVVTDLIAMLPASCALRLMSYGWRSFARLLEEKCKLLTMPLQNRVLAALESLAWTFGRRVADGILIDLPLSHSDLAQLAVGSRARVSRAIDDLRRAHRVLYRDTRIVLLASPRPTS